MAKLHSRQFQPEFTGSFTISGSFDVTGPITASQGLALTSTSNISGSAVSTGSFGRVEVSTISGDGSALTGVTAAALDIDSATDGTSATVATTDLLLFSDGGTEKKMQMKQMAAPLASVISGSFASVSSSLASRLASEEGEAEGTVVSSSAQIASDISGSVLNPSGNVSGSSTSTGSFGRAEIAGVVSATSYTGDGSSLTGITSGPFVQTGSLFAGSSNIQITGSLNVSSSITATNATTSSTAIYTSNVQNGYPTSNEWGVGLGGSYFNNFDNTSHVSEILRFMSGVMSHSLDVSDAAANAKTYGSIDTNENNLGSTDALDGYLPQSYDSSNATMKYLVTKQWVAAGTTAFSGISVYHDNGPTYYVDFDSNSTGTGTVSSSADSELFGLGGLSSGAAVDFKVRVVATQSFSDTGSVATPSATSNTFTTQSRLDLTTSAFGTTNGLTLAKINTAQPAVIPAAYQDGKFADVGGTSLSGSLSRKYGATATDFTSVSASGYYNFHDLKVGIITGSQTVYTFQNGTDKNRFWAPIDQIDSDVGTNSLGIAQVTQSYLTATSRSLSGVPYLSGSTYHVSASIRGLFNPMYAASTTIVDDTIGSVGVGSVATSGVYDVSTSGGTIQTSNAVWSSDSGSVRATSTVPYRQDVVRFNAKYTFSGTTGENINETGVGDTTFTVTPRARNRKNSRSNLATYTFLYHTASSFEQPASSGSMAVYQRAQGYDGGALTGTSEAFTGESFRIKLNNNVLGFNGDAFTTTYSTTRAVASRVLGENDLQVKPGFLVNPSGSYRYWYAEGYGTGSYKYYIRRFQTSGTKTSMTIDAGVTLANWKATTEDSVAAALLFKSSASGSGTNSELSVARIYDPSELTSNLISSSVAHQADFHLNPFSSALHLYGNTGGSKSTTQYTVPIRNADGIYLDSNDNELYVILRYKRDPTPVTSITLTFS